MLIDQNKLPLQALENFRGGKGSLKANIFADEHGKIIFGRLTPADTIGQHTHETSGEIIYIISGNGVAVHNGVEERLSPGVCHYCPKGDAHAMYNDGEEDLVFFAVVAEYGE